MEEHLMLVGGKRVASQSAEWIESDNPFTAQPWARVPRAGCEEVDVAVATAKSAFHSSPWRGMTATARGELLYRLADLVEENAEELSLIETKDNGKLISEMSAQVGYLAKWFRYYGGLCDKIEGAVLPIDKPGVFNYTTPEPLGVIAAITPWNSPLLLATWKLAPALAAGNTVVWKPSEYSSVSALVFATLFKEAGFPDGVVNVITGYGSEIGDHLVRHPDVAKVAFTGGDATGQHVYEASASGIKDVTLELGGKSANIVFADASLDNAVKGVVSGIFAATGQTCIAGSRALVEKSIHDDFVAKLVEFAGTAKIGDPLDRSTQVGPVTTKQQFDKIIEYINIAKAEGARCLLGGGPATGKQTGGGRFVAPTVFADVSPNMRIAQEEVFGPVLSIIPFENEDEAIHIANDTIYGLAAGVWTTSLGRALSIPARLEAGTIWVNTYRMVSFMSPFGGYKRSGIGRESGIETIRQYLQTKSVWIDTIGNTPNPFQMR